jgi:hypothetical protein
MEFGTREIVHASRLTPKRLGGRRQTAGGRKKVESCLLPSASCLLFTPESFMSRATP